jgi:hypothetical protein
MSADNFYIVRRHSDGGFTPVHGFASDDETPKVNPERNASFPTIDSAIESVIDEYTEYGIRVHPECKSSK